MNAVTTMTANPSNSALMLSQGLLAGHFTRAEQLQILNPEGNVIATLANPAAAEGCHGKQALLDALAHHQVGQVVVRNIGERMLCRLLAANIRVLQCRSARLPLPALLAPANLQPLTEASQGARLAVIRANLRSVPSSLLEQARVIAIVMVVATVAPITVAPVVAIRQRAHDKAILVATAVRVMTSRAVAAIITDAIAVHVITFKEKRSCPSGC
ncbi:NifB/NifX family molybdenum-iron cluster-binding protein [Aeromonas veronii]